MNTTHTEKAKITNRVEPCNCGCKGRDTWHAAQFSRIITDIKEENGFCKVTAYNGTIEYRKTGEAKFPWGTETVVEMWRLGRCFGWYIMK